MLNISNGIEEKRKSNQKSYRDGIKNIFER